MQFWRKVDHFLFSPVKPHRFFLLLKKERIRCLKNMIELDRKICHPSWIDYKMQNIRSTMRISMETGSKKITQAYTHAVECSRQHLSRRRRKRWYGRRLTKHSVFFSAQAIEPNFASRCRHFFDIMLNDTISGQVEFLERKNTMIFVSSGIWLFTVIYGLLKIIHCSILTKTLG